MNRKLVLAAVPALLGVVAASVLVWRAAGDAGATAPLPSPSPSFSSIRMSTINAEYDGAHMRLTTGTFLADETGDVRVRESLGIVGRSPATTVYQAGTHALMRVSSTDDGRFFFFHTDSVSPDHGMRTSPVSPFEYSYSAAAIVRAAIAENDPALAVGTTTFLGRPAWRATWTRGGWRKTVTVDRATGFPLRYDLVALHSERRCKSVWRVVDIETDVPVCPADFTLTAPPGAEVDEGETYEHFVTTGQFAANVGYQPFLPTWLPDGSVLDSASTQPAPWGPYGWIFPYSYPWSDLSKLPDNEVHLYYHRGYDWFTVTESPREFGPRNSIPGQLDRRPPFAYRRTVLASGAFAGKTARTWIGDGVVLYVQNSDHAVMISGDLTRSGALAVAQSLQQ